MTLKDSWWLLKETGKEWSKDKVPRLGAALSYYTALSLAPLLVIALAVAGLVFDKGAARDQLRHQVQDLIGSQGWDLIRVMLDSAGKPTEGGLAAILGVVMLLFGAGGVFGELQDSLNTIWEVQPKPGRPILTMIRERFLSFTMVVGIGFLLLVSLLVSTVLSALTHWLGGYLAGLGYLWQALNFVVSLGVFVLLFAMIFKILPDVNIGWKDVWLGAGVTALLFGLGKFLIGLYLGNSGVGSAYGAAGSLVVLLVWVFYSAQILFFGAEFTKVYANKFGAHIVPAANAEPVTAEARAHQGIPKTRASEPVA
jgi:membrane protein